MKPIVIMVGLLMMGYSSLFAQNLPEKSPSRDDVFIRTEKMPVFPGGQDSLMAFIQSHIKYPAKAKTGGKVLVSFIVDKHGKVKEATIKKSENDELNKEALRVVSSLPE